MAVGGDTVGCSSRNSGVLLALCGGSTIWRQKDLACQGQAPPKDKGS